MKTNQTKTTRELKALNLLQNETLYTLPVIEHTDKKVITSENAMRLIGMVWSGGISAAAISHAPQSYSLMTQ